MRRPPKTWACLAAGASAGVAVVAFMAVPWPIDLVVVPALGGWLLLLAAAASRQGWRRPSRPLLVWAVLIAVGLGAAMWGLLGLLVT